MHEDDMFEAIEFNSMDKHNIGATRGNDGRKKLEISNSVPPYVTKQQSRENLSRQTHEIEDSKGKYNAVNIKELTSNNTVQNILSSDQSVKKRLNDGVKCNINHVMSPCISDVTNDTVMHKLENKGFLINGMETIKRGKAFVMEKITSLGTIVQYCPAKDEAVPYRDVAEEIPKRKRFSHMSIKNEENTDGASCTEKNIINEVFSCKVNQGATLKVLDDAVQDFNSENDYVDFRKKYSFGKSNAKKSKDQTVFQQNHIYHEMRKNDIETLGDALTYFRLSSYLEKLEMSLEDVRRNKKEKEDHADIFKQVDREIQKLSFKYHPDRVKNGGGTEKEMAKAQKDQTAINATRTVLKLLNSAFIEDIDIDHKFEFYTKLSISSLCNEDEIKNHVNEVILKIGMISQIKQQNIILEIRKFLIEGKSCIHSYLNNINDFVKYRDLALFHLKCCIKGFEKLCVELEDVIKQCKSEKNGENIHSLIQNMASDRKRDLRLLKLLDKTAKASLKGKYRFFSSVESMDPYFVLPLVFYTNVILMCNVMVRNESRWDILNLYSQLDLHFSDDLEHLKNAYYIASYCSGNTYHEQTVLNIMDKNKEDFDLRISKEEIKVKFSECLKYIIEFMECKFKLQDYSEAVSADLLMLDLKKCMMMMAEFQEKQQELSKAIEKFEKKIERIDDKCEKLDRMIEVTQDLNQEVKERLEKSKKLSEKVSNALSKRCK